MKSWFNVRLSAFYLLCALLVISGCESFRGALELKSEKEAIHEAARRYFEAEVRMDLIAVYQSLAPSSLYRQNNSLEDYLKQAKAASHRIIRYEIVRISHLSDNQQRDVFPKIDKFARVEVALVMQNIESNRKTEVNYDYVFIKEGGKWYKG